MWKICVQWAEVNADISYRRCASLTMLRGMGACPGSRGMGADPSPLRNRLNEEITPLLPAGIGERCSQTRSNLGHAALLRRCELPL